MRRHPSRRQLQRWLETGKPKRVEAHVAECEICQAILEELSQLDGYVVADLESAIAPPDDLTLRTNSGVDERLRDEAAAGAFLDLFTIGWDVARSVLDPTTTTVGGAPHGGAADADEAVGGTP
ncbi:MAG: hypothetical protein AAGC53_18045 [Actinomycetota bacterium]